MSQGYLEFSVSQGTAHEVQMNEFEFLLFDEFGFTAIGTSNMGGCSAVMVVSKFGAILGHVAPLPENFAENPNAGDENAQSQMDLLEKLYTSNREFFPPGSAGCVVVAVYKGETALPYQLTIFMKTLAKLDLPTSLKTYNVPETRPSQAPPGQGTVFVEGTGCSPVVYIEDVAITVPDTVDESTPGYTILYPPACGSTAENSWTSGNTVAYPSTSGSITANFLAFESAVADWLASENTTADSSTSGNTIEDSSAFGNTIADSSNAGITTTDWSTSGTTIADSSTSGNTITDSSTSENTIAELEAPGNITADSPISGNTTADSSPSGSTTANSPTSGITTPYSLSPECGSSSMFVPIPPYLKSAGANERTTAASETSYYFLKGTTYYYNENGVIKALPERPNNEWIFNEYGWSDTNWTKMWRYWDGKDVSHA